MPEKKKTQDKIASMIITVVSTLQKNWVVLMQRIMNRIPAGKQKAGVIILVILTGGYSLYIAARSLVNSPQPILKVESIRSPKYVTKTGDEKIQSAIFITESEYRKIEQFKKYMDSLSNTSKGKRIRDSILLARPGLMDSVLQLEAIYQLQKQNKK